MKYRENIWEVAALAPDYMGFIFWERSPRFFKGNLPQLPSSIKKTGVFVNADITTIVSAIRKYQLQAVQLHGNESPQFCAQLQPYCSEENTEIIKVFSVSDHFDSKTFETYEAFCHYYLFDTRGKLPGGNGKTFDWTILNDYPSQKPFFLSGGIGIETVENIKNILHTTLPVYAIDVNSRFELQPGYKASKALKTFIKLLQTDSKES